MEVAPSPSGSTQGTADGRYVIVQANSKDWVAYDIGLGTAAQEIGTRNSEADARALCESAERALMASVRRQA